MSSRHRITRSNRVKSMTKRGTQVIETVIKECLEALKFGEIQDHKNVAVIPIIGTNGIGQFYLTMKEAMEQGLLTVSKVSEGGNVPELKVSNRGDKPVLLLDGEELAGAKQNRVLNTTMLSL